MYTKFNEETIVVKCKDADLWVSKNSNQTDVQYYYGGTRTICAESNEDEAFQKIEYLKKYESGLKNIIINDAVANGVLDEFAEELPAGFLNSKVGGGRCVIVPKSKEAENILTDPSQPGHEALVKSLFKDLGEALNEDGMQVKLTPDFGSFAGLADLLNEYTENVLGIACEKGGCGGKSSYTSTGINQAAITLGAGIDKNVPITIVGAEGGCGKGCKDYFIDNGFTDIAVSDLKYKDNPLLVKELEEKGVKVLPSEFGKITSECLSRGGYILVITVGGEIMNSDVSVIKEGTYLLLAHNEAISADEDGISFIENLQKDKKCCICPGQILTFGGALTSRLEWFFRQSHKGEYFPKPLAHKIVAKVTDYAVRKYYSNPFEDNAFRELYGKVQP